MISFCSPYCKWGGSSPPRCGREKEAKYIASVLSPSGRIPSQQLPSIYTALNSICQLMKKSTQDLLNNHNNHDNVKGDEVQLCSLMSHTGKSTGKEYKVKVKHCLQDYHLPPILPYSLRSTYESHLFWEAVDQAHVAWLRVDGPGFANLLVPSKSISFKKIRYLYFYKGYHATG